MAKLNEFISLIKTKGLMRTARYTVLMGVPETLRSSANYNNVDLNNIAILCDQVQVPGLNYSTSAVTTYGESREVPYTRLYDNITMSFYVSNDMITKTYFDDWLFTIQHPDTRTFNYYNNYITDITIMVEDLNDNSIYQVQLFECYPKSISSIQMDYAGKEVMKLTINMAYKYWKPVTGTRLNKSFEYFNAIAPEYMGIFTGVTW